MWKSDISWTESIPASFQRMATCARDALSRYVSVRFKIDTFTYLLNSGIPNTAHFANVTEIEDALALWAKLKEQKAHERFNPHIDEEFEDSEGNVVNRKTYDDMRRQGIL